MAGEENRELTFERIMRELQMPANHFRYEGDNRTRCLVCTTSLVGLKKYKFENHLNTAKHQRAIERHNQPIFPEPHHVANLSSRQSPFSKDFAAACIKSDICLDKACRPHFVEFFERHTKHKMPHPTTISKTYVPIIYEETLEAIREEIGNNPIWVSADETIDAQRRCVTNVIIGALCEDKASTGRLIKCGELLIPNAENMAAFIITTLNEFFPNFDANRVLLYLTDAAPYMKASAVILKRTYPKLVNVTCLAHACHNIAEKVRECYGEVNSLIASAKEVYSKSRTRTEAFKNALPNVPLPPRPVTTRWGTWIEACQYYCLHYEEVEGVFLNLPPNSIAVQRLQDCLDREWNEEEFEEISLSFSCLVTVIKQLQKRGCSLARVCEIVAELREELEENMEIDEEIRAKVEQVFENNEGLLAMINVNDCILNGVMQNLPDNWVDEDARRMKFAPLTCADVERSFSIYKAYYRSNRQSMKFRTLGQHMVINYNQNIGREENAADAEVDNRDEDTSEDNAEEDNSEEDDAGEN